MPVQVKVEYISRRPTKLYPNKLPDGSPNYTMPVDGEVHTIQLQTFNRDDRGIEAQVTITTTDPGYQEAFDLGQVFALSLETPKAAAQPAVV